MSFLAKVGHFTKSIGGAPASQAITGVGFQPKALILWTSGGTADGTIQTQATLDARGSLGFVSSSATADQYAAGFEADTAGNGGRRLTQKAILLLNAAGTVVSEASLSSFDSDGFTLSWTTNSTSETQVIHYLALGGTDVQAKVISISAAATTGNFATTGAGFQPNALLSIGSLTLGSLDLGNTPTLVRLGAAVSAANRWAVSAASWQSTSSQAWRYHRNDRFILQVTADGATSAEIDHVSMDADGFTLNNVAGTAARAGILALRVPVVALGTFVKPTGGAPAVQATLANTALSKVVLLCSDQDINRSNVASQTGARFGLSAFTDVEAESSVMGIPDAPNPLTFSYLEKSGKAAVKINNATPAIDAEATAAFGGDGFTLTWNANDAVATEYGYVAFGDFARPRPSLGPRKAAGGANRGRLARGAFRRRTN